ncbi:MAG: penicillin-binding transpeptidase domain-containing protein [Candidatus Parcubacteria bacterium]|nr:penicillin-binding transpeptidase domain-containing protein [Candidatus Parcubacteria bacterium]
MKFFGQKKRKTNIDPNEIFLDSSNLPNFDVNQFEGRIEKSISKYTVFFLGGLFFILQGIYLWNVGGLQIGKGDEMRARAENNRLEHSLVFANRGIIYDRNKVPLAWNVLPQEKADWEEAKVKEGEDLNDFPLRQYIADPGFGHLLGYLSYPAKDSSGFYYKKEYEGKGGVEKAYNDLLNGTQGLKIQEVDSLSKIHSESVIEPPIPGKDLNLTVDSRLQKELYKVISETANQVGFRAGSGVIMDVETGEILALVSFPEYEPQILTDGKDKATISHYQLDPKTPFLDRAVSGLYTPGSIVKPYMAIAALTEKVISPEKKILSTGSISIANPYFPDKPTVFKDWKAHGWVDMRDAIAVSSDVYFYEVGGGYLNEQKGLGIERIEKYMRMFGFGSPTGVDIEREASGMIPSPEWKKKNFDGADWLLGDTYHTSIGQYGFQVSPLQAVHAVSSIATEGTLVTPHVLQSTTVSKNIIPIPKENFIIAGEGMRRGVMYGVALALNTKSVNIAAKTGTAELGVKKDFVNSWITGFFPYEHPKYAFAIVMEHGPVKNLIGASYVMRQTVDWMAIYTPEYFKTQN